MTSQEEEGAFNGHATEFEGRLLEVKASHSNEMQQLQRGYSLERHELEDAYKMEIAQLEDAHLQEKNDLVKKFNQEKVRITPPHSHRLKIIRSNNFYLRLCPILG